MYEAMFAAPIPRVFTYPAGWFFIYTTVGINWSVHFVLALRGKWKYWSEIVHVVSVL
jgi:hypothetical protein